MKYKQICAIKSIVALIVFTSCILFFSTTLVSGAGEIPDEAKLEVIQFNAKQGINELVDYIIKWAFRLAGVLAFAMIVYAGFQYLTSGGNTAQQKDAQERIMSAIIGIVLLFAFYIVLYTINPDILKGSSDITALSAPEVTPQDQTTSNDLVNIISMGIPIDYITFGQYSEAFLDSRLASKLNQLKDINPSWHVHDACINSNLPCLTSISRTANDCHLDGTCVDIDSVSNSSEDNKKIREKFNKAGLAVLDEGDHLHVALPEATGYGSYPGSNACILEGCWYGAT